MAITFLGFYRPYFREADVETVRGSGQFLPEMRDKVKAFPSSLPDTCKLIGSWGVSGGEAPGVMVVEADSFSDIQKFLTSGASSGSAPSRLLRHQA